LQIAIDEFVLAAPRTAFELYKEITPLSAYYTPDGTRKDVAAKDISGSLKSAAGLLNYPSE
jgi:hypothetical protein